MKILGLIPARGGSKGIPRKNIKPLGGKPLIAYSIEAGLKSRYLDKVLVSTDDEEIAQVARQYGADVPFIRPAELARDDTPTLPVIQHALRFLADKGETYDAVCLLQPSSPFRTPAFIDAAIEKYVRSGADSLVTRYAVYRIILIRIGFLSPARTAFYISPRANPIKTLFLGVRNCRPPITETEVFT